MSVVNTIAIGLFLFLAPAICLGSQKSSHRKSNGDSYLMGPKKETNQTHDDFRYRYDGRSLVGRSDAYIRRNNQLQKSGYILLVVGGIISLTGIIIIESMGMYQIGPLGTVAFVGVGTGVGTLLSSFVLLGFSRPWHRRVPTATVTPQVVASPRGGVVGVSKAF